MTGGVKAQRMTEPIREWNIQRYINTFRDEYENWPGCCEQLRTRDEMKAALAECNERWPDYAFRGRNVVNQRPTRPGCDWSSDDA